MIFAKILSAKRSRFSSNQSFVFFFCAINPKHKIKTPFCNTKLCQSTKVPINNHKQLSGHYKTLSSFCFFLLEFWFDMSVCIAMVDKLLAAAGGHTGHKEHIQGYGCNNNYNNSNNFTMIRRVSKSKSQHLIWLTATEMEKIQMLTFNLHIKLRCKILVRA